MTPIIPNNNFHSSDELNPNEMEALHALASLSQNTKDTASPFFLNQPGRSKASPFQNNFRNSEVSTGSEREKEGFLNSSFSNSPLAQSLGERSLPSMGQTPSSSMQPIFHRLIGQTTENLIGIASGGEERNRAEITLEQPRDPYCRVSLNSRELRREQNHPFSRISQNSRLIKSDIEERSTVSSSPFIISSSLPKEQVTSNRQGVFAPGRLSFTRSQAPILSQQTPSVSKYRRQANSSSCFGEFQIKPFQGTSRVAQDSIFHEFDLNETSQTLYTNRQIISPSMSNSHENDIEFSQLRNKFETLNTRSFQKQAEAKKKAKEREIEIEKEKRERPEIYWKDLTLAPFMPADEEPSQPN